MLCVCGELLEYDMRRSECVWNEPSSKESINFSSKYTSVLSMEIVVSILTYDFIHLTALRLYQSPPETTLRCGTLLDQWSERNTTFHFSLSIEKWIIVISIYTIIKLWFYIRISSKICVSLIFKRTFFKWRVKKIGEFCEWGESEVTDEMFTISLKHLHTLFLSMLSYVSLVSTIYSKIEIYFHFGIFVVDSNNPFSYSRFSSFFSFYLGAFFAYSIYTIVMYIFKHVAFCLENVLCFKWKAFRSDLEMMLVLRFYFIKYYCFFLHIF